jgi:hypothetical protein
MVALSGFLGRKKIKFGLAFTNDYCTFAPAENRTP